VTEPIHEIALTTDEVREILAQCGPHALLVGGQALAMWASVYAVTPPKVLAASISSDADFIGNATLARKLGETGYRPGTLGGQSRYRLSGPSDRERCKPKRWPQITQLVEERQRKYQQQRARRGKPK
jgi:hypothetical protein